MASTPVSVLGNPNTPTPCNPGRRQLLIATAGVGGVLAAAAAVPFVASLTRPSGPWPRARRWRWISTSSRRAK
jgi:hypothetical protein